MSRCNLLKNGVWINQAFEIDYCCEVTDDGYRRPVFTDFPSFLKYREPLYEESKTKWIRGCEGCKHNEKLVGTSLRTVSNESTESATWEPYKPISEDDYYIHHAILNLSNTCNLACRMCDSGSSTKWQSYIRSAPSQRQYNITEISELSEQDQDWVDKTGGMNDDNIVENGPKEFIPALCGQTEINEEQYEELKKYVLTPHLRKLVFGGGEPTQIKLYLKILNYLIENDYAKNIKLHIHTNGTKNMSDEWRNILEPFKQVEIVYSIDGTESNYEYIRTDSNWEVVSENIQSTADYYQNNNKLGKEITMGVAYCFQALNAHRFKSDKEYFENNLTKDFHYQTVFFPPHLSLQVVHPELRKKYGIEVECEDIKYDEKLARKFIASQRWMDGTFQSNTLKEQNPDFFNPVLYPFAEEIYAGTDDWNQDPNAFT